MSEQTHNLNAEAMDTLKIGEWMARGEFVHGLFNGLLNRGTLVQQAAALGIPSAKQIYYALILAPDMKNGKDVPYGEQGPYKLRLERQIEAVCKEISEETGMDLRVYFTVDINPAVSGLITVNDRTNSSQAVVEQLVQRILAMNTDESERIITVALGSPCRKLQEVTDSVTKLREVLRNRHNRALGIICRESEYQEKKPILDRISLPIGFLLFYVRAGDAESAEREIRRIFKSFRDEESLSLDSARIVTMELAITIFKANTTKENELVSYLYILNHIQKLNTIMEMEEEVATLAVQAAEHRVANENRRTRLAEQAVDYIHIHHSDESLNLQMVANELSISVPYLTLLLREETGKTFSAHLQTIRLERAKQLLLTTDESVAKIAAEVGYGSSQYFSTTFKEFTGVAPGKFRISGPTERGTVS